MRPPRLFLACPVSALAAERLLAFMQSATEALELRWVRPDDLHVTVAFFGETPNEHLAAMIEETKLVRWNPIDVALGGLVRLGRSALAFDLTVPPGQLHSLQARLQDRNDPLGRLASRSGEDRSWRPHVTVARSYPPLRVPQVQLQDLRWKLDRVGLYEGLPRVAGPRYRCLAYGESPEERLDAGDGR